MPTNQNAYNSRVTDEALEKRFRDTFRSQGGAELVDDLYASGVIVPVVDFTQAATGDVLAQNLQTAWDFSTQFDEVSAGTTTIINNSGFWQVDFTLNTQVRAATPVQNRIYLSDGLTTKTVWAFKPLGSAQAEADGLLEDKFIVFLRAGDSLNVTSGSSSDIFSIWYRQIATVNGDLVNPTGFTSS